MWCAGAQGWGRRIVLYIASEHLHLPCPTCKTSPCKPSPFHALAQWTESTIFHAVSGVAQIHTGSGSGPVNPSIWTLMLCLLGQRDRHRDFYQGLFKYHDDALSTILPSVDSSSAVKGLVDLKLDQAAVFRFGEVPMGALPMLCIVSLLFWEEVWGWNGEESCHFSTWDKFYDNFIEWSTVKINSITGSSVSPSLTRKWKKQEY